MTSSHEKRHSMNNWKEPKFNEDGTLKTVNYFQLGDIQYACDEHGAALMFLSIYNPTPNDTNLEPK